MEFRSKYEYMAPVIWVERKGWQLWKGEGHRGTQEHVYCGRGYYVISGSGGQIWWCQVLWQKKFAMTLDMGQPIVVVGDGLNDIHGQQYKDDL